MEKKNLNYALGAVLTVALALPIGGAVRAHAQSMPGMPGASPTSSPGSSPSASPSAASGAAATQQLYTVQLNGLNSQFTNGGVFGTARVVLDGDRFGVEMNANGLFPGAHMAHIHKGDRCPTLAEDTNGDGIIDVIEGVPAYGPILINLDSDLGSFAGGADYSPSALASGVLNYIGSGSYSAMLKDLTRPAPAAATGVGTLASGEQLDLSKTHIVIHGIDPSIQLPAATQTVTGLSPSQSLPVACGQLVLSQQ